MSLFLISVFHDRSSHCISLRGTKAARKETSGQKTCRGTVGLNAQMMATRVVTLIRFWANHHLLDLTQRPVWRVVSGRSQSYVRAICEGAPPAPPPSPPAWAPPLACVYGPCSLAPHPSTPARPMTAEPAEIPETSLSRDSANSLSRDPANSMQRPQDSRSLHLQRGPPMTTTCGLQSSGTCAAVAR